MKPNFKLMVEDELVFARDKFPPIHSIHEGYAVIKEELDEFWEECKEKRIDIMKNKNMLKELVQIAAMCQRTAEDMQLFVEE